MGSVLFLYMFATHSLAHDLIVSHIEYYKSLLVGLLSPVFPIPEI